MKRFTRRVRNFRNSQGSTINFCFAKLWVRVIQCPICLRKILIFKEPASLVNFAAACCVHRAHSQYLHKSFSNIYHYIYCTLVCKLRRLICRISLLLSFCLHAFQQSFGWLHSAPVARPVLVAGHTARNVNSAYRKRFSGVYTVVLLSFSLARNGPPPHTHTSSKSVTSESDHIWLAIECLLCFRRVGGNFTQIIS